MFWDGPESQQASSNTCEAKSASCSLSDTQWCWTSNTHALSIVMAGRQYLPAFQCVSSHPEFPNSVSNFSIQCTEIGKWRPTELHSSIRASGLPGCPPLPPPRSTLRQASLAAMWSTCIVTTSRRLVGLLFIVQFQTWTPQTLKVCWVRLMAPSGSCLGLRECPAYSLHMQTQQHYPSVFLRVLHCHGHSWPTSHRCRECYQWDSMPLMSSSAPVPPPPLPARLSHCVDMLTRPPSCSTAFSAERSQET